MSSGESTGIDKAAFCRAGYHCWKKTFRLLLAQVWTCQWCGKHRVGA